MAFDGNQYRKKVLVPLAQQEQHDFSDAFGIFDLELDVDDQSAIERQVGAVVAFWQKERQRPKYRGLVEALLADQDRLRTEVLDPQRRAVARERSRAGQAEELRRRAARLDDAIALLTRQFGGVPTSRVQRLRELARRSGLTDADVDERLAAARLLDDGGGTDAVLPAAVRRQIAKTLTDLGALRGDRSGTRTLFAFLGLPHTATAEEIEQRRGEMTRRNRQRQHDREQTLTGEALAHVQVHLLQADRALYLNGLAEDAKDELRGDVHAACVVSDRLTAVEFERFTRALVGRGLTGDEARRAVAALAQEVGAPVETGAAVDYIACASCGSAEPDDGRERCRRCGAGLHQRCPSCGTTVAIDVLSCPRCRADFRAVQAAGELVGRADRELRAGRPATARQLATEALTAVPGHPDGKRIREEADKVLREAARDWTAVRDALRERRLYGALRRVERLAGTAADVPGPDDRDAATVVEELRAATRAFETQLNDARGVDGPERERRLLALAEEVADSDRLVAELARTPPLPAHRLTVAAHEGGVSVRWAPSPSPGEVAYRVVRETTAAPGASGEQRTVGQTGATHLEDGSAPLGRPFAYTVTAVRAGAVSEPLRSAATLLLRDVTHLAAEGRDGEVVLRWRPPAGGVVQLQRVELADDGSPGPIRRIRPDGDGYVDTHVRNGTTYEYTVYCEARPPVPGAENRTAGVRVRVRPRARLQPLRDLRVERDGAGVRLHARRPGRGSITVVRLREGVAAPDAGTWLAAADLARLGERLARDGDAHVDRSPPSGVSRYLPVTVLDSDAVAGQVVPHLGTPPVTGLVAQDAGAAIGLTWAWPPGCTEALVCWRRDRYPEGPDDPRAEKAKTTNTAYEIREGWRLPDAEPEGPYFFSVFPGARLDGRLLWAPRAGADARLRVRGAPATATWSVRTRRTRLRRKSVVVEVRATGPMPELLVVGRAGAVPPAGREDGVEVARVPPLTDDAATVELVLADLEPPVAFAVFAAAEEEADLVRLEQPARELTTVDR